MNKKILLIPIQIPPINILNGNIPITSFKNILRLLSMKMIKHQLQILDLGILTIIFY